MYRSLKLSLAILCLAAVGFGQTVVDSQGSPAPTPGVLSLANAYQILFNTAYFASKPPAFQPLYDGDSTAANSKLLALSQTDRTALIAKLVAAGYSIDEQIEFWGWDPYMTMFIREQYGYQWVMPGLGSAASTNPNQPSYTGPAPAGSIKVSTLLADFPPFPIPAVNVPVVPPIPQVPNPVGMRIIPMVPAALNYVGDMFRVAYAVDGFAVGSTWTGTTGQFTGTWTKTSVEAGLMTVWVKTE